MILMTRVTHSKTGIPHVDMVQGEKSLHNMQAKIFTLFGRV